MTGVKLSSQALRREVPIYAAVQNKRAANGCKDVVKQVALAGGGVVFICVFGIHDVLCLVLMKWEK